MVGTIEGLTMNKLSLLFCNAQYDHLLGRLEMKFVQGKRKLKYWEKELRTPRKSDERLFRSDEARIQISSEIETVREKKGV